MSHYDNLVKKNGYSEIIHALSNLVVFHKHKNTHIADEAEKI